MLNWTFRTSHPNPAVNVPLPAPPPPSHPLPHPWPHHVTPLFAALLTFPFAEDRAAYSSLGPLLQALAQFELCEASRLLEQLLQPFDPRLSHAEAEALIASLTAAGHSGEVGGPSASSAAGLAPRRSTSPSSNQDPGALQREVQASVAAPEPCAALGLRSVKALEQRLLESLLALLTSAGFRPLTARGWELASSDAFTFDIPTGVRWAALDDSLLMGGMEAAVRSAAGGAELPWFSSRLLIFHRGVGQASARGRYLDQKLDLLVEMLTLQPLRRTAALIMRLATGQALPGAVLVDMAQTLAGGPHSADEDDVAAALGQGAEAGTGATAPRPGAAVVTRRSLRAALRTPLDVVRALWRQEQLVEPLLRDVVVVYRKAVAPERQQQLPPLTAESGVGALDSVLDATIEQVGLVAAAVDEERPAVEPPREPELPGSNRYNVVSTGVAVHRYNVVSTGSWCTATVW